MLAISKTTLVRDLLSMREPPFPGASYLALQFFAFYASWLRFWFCPGKVLRLGGAVLEELRKWGDSGEEQEKELARTVRAWACSEEPYPLKGRGLKFRAIPVHSRLLFPYLTDILLPCRYTSPACWRVICVCNGQRLLLLLL